MPTPALSNFVKQPINSRHPFAIASALLGDARPIAWSNLGFWQNTRCYITACEQLAQQVGLAAGLTPDDTLLDLGCGQGASLLYWHMAFGIKSISAIEIQPDCVQAIRQARLPALEAVYQGSFAQLPLPSPQLQQAFDAVLCVDAAYHAQPADFLAVAHRALRPQGRLAYTTLCKSKQWDQPSASYRQKLLQRFTLTLLNTAYVPECNMLSISQLDTQLQQAGFTSIEISQIDQQVLQGFGDYMHNHQRPPFSSTNFSSKPSNSKNSSATRAGTGLNQRLDWLKIVMTGQLCRFLARHQLIHYVLVSATRAA